jgi:hypothetical protein
MVRLLVKNFSERRVDQPFSQRREYQDRRMTEYDLNPY